MSPKPNILFITTDQQRADCLGCAGHPVLETPYLDELASHGCRFTNAFSAVPSCIPARTAILTGMSQWNHGRLASLKETYLQFPATLPGELTRGGYQTCAVGKMHFYPQRAHYGFEQMVLDESARERGFKFTSDYRRWFEEAKEGSYGYLDHGVGWNSWMARPTHLPEHLHPTHWTASEGISFLKRRDPSRPFFMWLSFARPHSPYDPPSPYFDLYHNDPAIPKPLEGDWSAPYGERTDDVNAFTGSRSKKDVAKARAGYYGNITFIDHQIGRVLYELERHDAAALENTLIVFTSDHGDMLGDHFHWRKARPYQGSMHIPLFISFPKNWKMPRGKTSQEPVELRDIMPTLLDAAGLAIPDSVDGKSLLSLVRNEATDWRPWLQCEHNTGDNEGWQCVTDGREKYIWYHHTGRERFFDLINDPGETRDLSANPDSADRVAIWRRRLAMANEERGDVRGQNGCLVPLTNHDPSDPALSLTPNFWRWKEKGEARLKELGVRLD